MQINSFTKLLLVYILFCSFYFAQEVEIISDGNDRSFRINLPSNADEPFPLMFILHGLGESSTSWYGVASYIKNQGFVTVRPESGAFLSNTGTSYLKLWNAIMDSNRYDDVKFIVRHTKWI